MKHDSIDSLFSLMNNTLKKLSIDTWYLYIHVCILADAGWNDPIRDGKRMDKLCDHTKQSPMDTCLKVDDPMIHDKKQSPFLK